MLNMKTLKPQSSFDLRLLSMSALAVVSLQCATEPLEELDVEFDQQYQAVGIERVTIDGTAVEQRSFTLTLANIQAGIEEVTLDAVTSTGATNLDGVFAPESGFFDLGPGTGTLTGTVSSTVSVGGRLVDALPRNGLAEEVLGYTHVESEGRLVEGVFFAVNDLPDRPPTADCLTIRTIRDHVLLFEAPAGCLAFPSSLEFIRLSLTDDPSVVFSIAAEEDGSVGRTLEGQPDEQFLVWVRSRGRASPAIAIPVSAPPP